MNKTTRKHPRTMNEAFGPYCGALEEVHSPYSKLDKALIALSFAVVIGGPLLMWLGVI